MVNRLPDLTRNKFQNSETNKVCICKHELAEIGLSERETVQTAMLLQEGDFIRIENKSVHNDLSMSMSVTLKPSCVHYFDNKKTETVNNRRSWIQTYIPNILSVIAIGISIIALIVSLSQKV